MGNADHGRRNAPPYPPNRWGIEGQRAEAAAQQRAGGWQSFGFGIGIGASITIRAQDGNEQEIWWGGKRMEDNTSNNEAEYQALILGLQSLKDNGWECEPTLVMSDSQLVVRQLAGSTRFLQ